MEKVSAALGMRWVCVSWLGGRRLGAHWRPLLNARIFLGVWSLLLSLLSPWTKSVHVNQQNGVESNVNRLGEVTDRRIVRSSSSFVDVDALVIIYFTLVGSTHIIFLLYELVLHALLSRCSVVAPFASLTPHGLTLCCVLEILVDVSFW